LDVLGGLRVDAALEGVDSGVYVVLVMIRWSMCIRQSLTNRIDVGLGRALQSLDGRVDGANDRVLAGHGVGDREGHGGESDELEELHDERSDSVIKGVLT
jgi:hypothetical protein